MISSYLKTVIRQIIGNPRRFFAILSIVVLGVSFYSGVRAASPNMRLTVDKYFDEYNSSDIQIISTMGFDDGDIKAISSAKDVDIVMPGYSVDGFMKKGDRTLLINFQSLDLDSLNSRPDTVLNRPAPVEGRLPVSKNECVLDSMLKDFYGFNLGDSIKILTADDPTIADSLGLLEYRVVGFVNSVQHISIQRGSSNKGEGVLSGFALIPKQNFKMDVYTQVFIKVKNTDSSRFSDNYVKRIDGIEEEIKQIGNQHNPLRYKEIVAKAEKELAKGRKEIKDAEQKLIDGEKELQNGERKLADGEKELAKNRKKYENEIKSAENELNRAKAELKKAKAELEDSESRLGAGKSALEKAKSELKENRAKLTQGEQALSQLNAQIAALSSQLELLPPDSPEAAGLAAQISQLQGIYQQQSKELENAKKQYEQGAAQISANQKELENSKAQLKKGWEEYRKGESEYQKNLSLFEKSKTEGARELDKAQRELDKSRRELEKAKQEYADKKPDALAKIEDAKKKLAEGEQELEDLKEPEWYILDLEKNTGFSGYRQDTDRVAAIGLVFPLIFFLVAALVSLTTMTRIVEDERQNIGILKALGFHSFSIAAKYLIYSGTAALLGIGIGIAIGPILFSRVIGDAYGIIYTLPTVQTAVDPGSALIAGVGAFASAVLPALLVCYKELAAVPATLMRPRAPKHGRRILLEQVSLIWNRLNFSQKVTCRNLFRYKKKLFMTILGVAGCTALVFTGFGLRDSIRMMVPLQYDEIQKFDFAVYLKNTVSQQQKTQLDGVLTADSNVKNFVSFHQAETDAKANGLSQSAYLIVTGDRGKFKDFIALRGRKDKTPITLSDNSVVISEKLGKMLKLKAGDTLTLSVKEKPDITVKVAGLAENYVLHYVYMTDELYRSLYGETAVTNAVYGQLFDKSEQAEGELSRALINLDYVANVSYTATLRDNFFDMVSAMDIVVVVLILSAAALAFIVLFSLTNINIDERRRELATLKVLGFNNVETNMYLYRESIILTLIGIACGLVLGIFTRLFVVTTAEVDIVMFARQTDWLNYVFSALITLSFSVIVNLFMSISINRIDMVESLKSVE
jgi:putative ABC transport system permease protein